MNLECSFSVRAVLADLASSLYNIKFSYIAHEIEELWSAWGSLWVCKILYECFQINSHQPEISVIGAQLQLPQTCERVVTMHAVHSLAGNL